MKGNSSSTAPVETEKPVFGCPTIPSEFEGLIFVRYLDHVIFSRASALTLKPQVREAVGWLVYECDYYVTLTWDRDSEPPTLKGGDPKASGLVVLKTDIQELKRLGPLQNNCYCHLNSATTNSSSEYALQANGAKNSAQNQRGKDKQQCKRKQ